MGTVQYQTTQTADTTLVTTAETVVATLSGVNTPRRTSVYLKGWAQLTTGVATTAVTPRIRRDSVSGTLVGEGNAVTIGAAAGGTEDFEVEGIDSGVDLANGTYVLTLAQTAATGNGTALQAGLSASMPE